MRVPRARPVPTRVPAAGADGQPLLARAGQTMLYRSTNDGQTWESNPEFVDQTVQQRRRFEQQIQEISQEQGRMRENMGKLAQNSELYNRYVRKLDQQETEIDKIRKDIETLKGTEEQQRKELNDYLMGLDIG